MKQHQHIIVVSFRSEQSQSPHYCILQQPHQNGFTSPFINSIFLHSHTVQLWGRVSSTQAEDVVIACTEDLLLVSEEYTDKEALSSANTHCLHKPNELDSSCWFLWLPSKLTQQDNVRGLMSNNQIEHTYIEKHLQMCLLRQIYFLPQILAKCKTQLGCFANALYVHFILASPCVWMLIGLPLSKQTASKADYNIWCCVHLVDSQPQ